VLVVPILDGREKTGRKQGRIKQGKKKKKVATKKAGKSERRSRGVKPS